MSRIRIFALFAILAALATTFAACGGGDDEGGGSGSDDPQQVVESASLEGVKSGEMDLSLQINAEGEDGGEVDLTLSGPFEERAKGELPQADLDLTVDGTSEDEDIKFAGGLTLLTDRAFVDYEGSAYEVDPTTFGFLKSAFEQAQQQGGEEDITACQEAAEGIEFSQLADNLESEGGADVDGTSTTKVSGDLNISGTIDALVELTENPACASQLEQAGPLPLSELEEAKGELSKAVDKAHLDLYVGEDDIVRRVTAELVIVPPDAADEKVEMNIDFTLSGVNEEQTFEEPENAKPLEALFKKLDVNPLELLEAAQGEGGLGGLLEGATGGTGTGSSSGGGSAGGNSDAYVQCLQEAQNAAQVQKCTSLVE